MPTDELGGRVNHHVGTMLNGAENDGCKGIVNDDHDVVFVCNLCNRIQVGHIAVRITECLYIHSLCVRTNGSLKRLKVIHVHNRVADALCGERVCDEVVGTAIEVVGCHDMVAILGNVLQCISDGCCTRCYSKACHTTFEGSHAVFKHALGGVGQTTIDVTRITKSETVGCML